MPAEAKITINIRATTRAKQVALYDQIMGLKPHNPEAELVIEGNPGTPPMERTPEIAALFKRAQALAAGMGIPHR